MSKQVPKLRTVNKSVPPFPLNEFPPELPFTLGREVIYLLSTKGTADLEGSEWERIFAQCIKADWKPSNVGLDDVVLGNTAWGAKTLKSSTPSTQTKVRLISGRCSPQYSFGKENVKDLTPGETGELVLDIWNERVSSIRQRYKHLRTVVLIKSNDLSEVVVFEFDTIRYDHDLYDWSYNKRDNLEGVEKRTGEHKFTWQPHGSQFTIIETVPAKAIQINIEKPPLIDRETVLKGIGFRKEWITVQKIDR